MKKYIYLVSILVLGVLSFACESDKTYDGPAQIAFAGKTAAFTVTQDSVIVIPVQLIADGVQGDIPADILVNTASTCAAAVTVPASVTIASGRFVAEAQIAITHSQLAAGNANKLILNLASTNVKVAENYREITITITKR
jgi:hypothetical protein